MALEHTSFEDKSSFIIHYINIGYKVGFLGFTLQRFLTYLFAVLYKYLGVCNIYSQRLSYVFHLYIELTRRTLVRPYAWSLRGENPPMFPRGESPPSEYFALCRFNLDGSTE